MAIDPGSSLDQRIRLTASLLQYILQQQGLNVEHVELFQDATEDVTGVFVRVNAGDRRRRHKILLYSHRELLTQLVVAVLTNPAAVLVLTAEHGPINFTYTELTPHKEPAHGPQEIKDFRWPHDHSGW